MKLAIVGAGAIGGWLASQLIGAGEEVTLVARGATFAAISERGLSIITPEKTFVVHPSLEENVSAVTGADVVFLAVKAHALTALAPSLGAALGPDVVPRVAPERHPLVVLPRPPRALRRLLARECRPGRGHRGAPAGDPGGGLGRLPGGAGRGSRGSRAHRGASHLDRGAGRLDEREVPADRRRVDPGGSPLPRAGGPAQRALAEARRATPC